MKQQMVLLIGVLVIFAGALGFLGVERVMAQQEITEFCVNRYNGDMRLSRTDVCTSFESLIEVADVSPYDVCVNLYNGDMRYPRDGQPCTPFETQLVIDATENAPGQTPEYVDVCVDRYNGDMRHPRVGQCASTETLYVLRDYPPAP